MTCPRGEFFSVGISMGTIQIIFLVSLGLLCHAEAIFYLIFQESTEFFVMTNMVITPNQTRGVCPEDPKFVHNLCKSDKDCIPGEAVINGNGKLCSLFF